MEQTKHQAIGLLLALVSILVRQNEQKNCELGNHRMISLPDCKCLNCHAVLEDFTLEIHGVTTNAN